MVKRFIALTLVLLILLSAGCASGGSATTTPATTIPAKTIPETTSSTTTPPETTTPNDTTSTTSVPAETTTPAVTEEPQPPAHVSGMVYYRNPDISYPVNAAPAEQALEGAVVSISPESTASNASGKYAFPGVTPGYHTITVEKDGYIPTTVSWDFISGESYIFNIGFYQEPSVINPRPGFVNGIITWDAGGWLIDYYYKRGLFQPTYTSISEQAGGTLTTVSDPVFVKEVDETHVVMGTTHNNGDYWRMMNDTEYSILVNDAHSKGLEFMLWLGIIDGGAPMYWDIVYSSSAPSNSFWNDWFSEYEKYAVESASMAERLGIEYICLGHDMGYASGASKFSGGAPDCLARWEKLITAIRDVYHGKLVYFGGADPLRDYYEDNDYPPGFTALFDAIGLNIQSIHANFNPSLQELKTAVSDFLDRYISWQCPLFIMLRTPSVDGGTSFDTYIEPLLVVNHEADKHVMNVWQQADIYEAFFEVINERPVGNGEVMGLFSWGYNYLNDYLITPDHEPDGAMAMDKSGNIRGKPAEAVMRFWDFRK